MEDQSATSEFNQDFAQQFPLRILIAEDNLLNQKLIQKMLLKLGYEPVIVGDGSEALEAVKSSNYQLLLMDLQMPKMDGFEATRLIIEQVAEEDRPSIIALTAAISNEVEQDCINAGMEGFIAKPINLKTLADLIKKVAKASDQESLS